MREVSFLKCSLKSLLSSTFVLIFVILALIDIALIKIRPLQYISDLRFIPLDQHPLVSKIPVYMESNDKVDVLVLGSSLPMCAIALYDEKLYGVPVVKDLPQLRRYLGARYLEQQLGVKLGRPIKVSNLSISGCMASDLFIILSKSIEAGRRPSVAVLCIAPRDFVDNLIQPVGRTPPFEVLQDWKSLGDVLRRDLSPAETRELLVSAVWYFYRVKVDYRTFLSGYVSSLVSHPTSLFYSTQPTKIANNSASMHLAGLAVSSVPERPILGNEPGSEERRYNPPNFERFALEMNFFRKLLALCQSEHVQCVVVNMPMTAAYRARLDSRLDRQYMAETQRACCDYKAKYLNFNDTEFVESDFSDGFHTNVVGAEKVLNRLVSGCESSTGLSLN